MAKTPNTAPIPSTARLDRDVRRVVEPIKEQLETMKGRRPSVARLTKLESTATTAQIIDKINELLDRIEN